MSAVNAMIARGLNPGAGKLQAQQTQYGMDQNNLTRQRNAFVQDRAFNQRKSEFDQTMGANAMARDQARADEFAAREQEQFEGVMAKVMSAQDEKQARAIFDFGREEAVRLGFDPSGVDFDKDILPQYRAGGGASYGKTPIIGTNEAGDQVYATVGDDGSTKVLDIRPPGPDQKEIADTRKAQAGAAAAEAKNEEAERLKEQAALDKDALKGLAGQLLKNENFDSVYGGLQGAIPSMRQGVIDAEAEVDRLISLLTLENTSKMTGVLSESDIKILAEAGTILSNKRISDKSARKELKRIAGVLDKLGEGDKIGRFGVEVVEE